MHEKFNIIRRFKNEREFQIGVELLREKFQTNQARGKLSDLADVVIEAIADTTINEFQKKHGEIPSSFFICAMGKLGGRELTFSSDLDLVFIYETPEQINSEITPSVYYTKLAKQIISNIGSLTEEGKLYEVDTRLRPQGEQGSIVSSIEAFEKYYDESAWNWEFMALTRARIIYGEKSEKIESIIKNALHKPRELKKLTKKVNNMRLKLEEAFPTKKIWDIKHVRGGIIDLEFISQYLQLLHANKHPEILSRNLHRSFERIKKANIISPEIADTLQQASLFLNKIQTIIRMSCATEFDEETIPEGLQNLLVRYTKTKNFDELRENLHNTEIMIYEIFQQIVNSDV